MKSVLVLFTFLASVTTQQFLYPSRSPFSSDQIVQNILYDETSKRIFVGGTNQIIRLSDELTFNTNLVTGPYLDDPNCYYGLGCTDSERTMSNNVNKILLISKGQLIHCGSLFGGRCNASDMATLKISEYISSNNTSKEFWVASGKSNTLAITSPGLNNNQGLFVAVERGYRDLTLGAGYPFIASYYIDVVRSDQMFQRVEEGWMKMDQYAELYYMFSSSPYFYTVRKELVESAPLIISRTCLQDVGKFVKFANRRYISYIDLQWNCVSNSGRKKTQFAQLTNVITGKISVNLANSIGGSKGDEILIGLFYDESSNTHAICPYLINAINAKFDGTTGESNRCNHQFRSVSGDPVVISPIGTFSNQNITSILLFNVKDDNILVLGTNTGNVLKVVLRTGDRLKVTSRSMMTDPIIKLTSSSTVLYGLTRKRVFGHPLGDCGQYNTCETCVDAEDSFCGWCLLKSSCMQYTECSSKVQDFFPELWVNTKVSDSQCFTISGITPTYTRITNTTKVQGSALELVNALRGRDIICDWVYNGQTLSQSEAVLSESMIWCTSPQVDTSVIPLTSDNIEVTVRLRIETQPDSFFTFIEAFPLYYCQNNNRCFSCTTSTFDCKWCKDSNNCMHASEACGMTVQIATRETQCPMLVAKNYTIESNSDGELAISAINIPMSTEGDYKCLIATQSGLVETQAKTSQSSSVDQTITCSVPIYKIDVSGNPNFIPLIVTYKGVPVLNKDNLAQVIVYSCMSIKDCSSCKGLDPSYGCGWCTTKNACYPSLSCETRNLILVNKCNDPGPIISKVSPRSGPLQGGTLITVEGTDLSIKFEDVTSITVAGVPCDLQPINYRVSTRVCCITRRVERPSDGEVILRSSNGQYNTDQGSFFYQTASIGDVTPLVVLVTGGTNVTLRGTQLNIGYNKSVVLAGVQCDILSASDVIVCKTRAVESPRADRVELKIDNASYGSTVLFSYIAIPNVTEVSPINSIVDGGINITLKGPQGFSSITSAQIFFTQYSFVKGDVNVSSVSDCLPAVSDTEIICVTPSLNPGRVSSTDPKLIVNISLILENSYTKILEYTPFVLYPNPVITLANDTNLVLRAGDKLVIKGQYFDRVPGIKVFLNTTECEALDVSDTLISCTVPDLMKPPEENDRKKRATDETKDKKKSTVEKEILIQIRLGNYASSPIRAMFIKEIEIQSNIMGIIIACIAAGCVVLLLLIAVCLLHRRRLQQKKQFKHIMLQEMERIENRLAEECKQVFTELQTDLADLNSDFSPATIPYLSFDEYALKVLFPAQDDYPVLHDPEDLATVGDNLATFHSLIQQEQFLLTLVETLDKQRQVSKRDKSNIAALMIVSLMDDMCYITCILKKLLSKLITETVNSDARRVKLLLRRSEHITEKYLSNWLTFNLHSFITEAAGQPLYVLYRAIKQQIEKGPVDYITGNARYALHEKNLLSKITEFYKLNVMVYLEDDPYLADTHYTPLKSSQVSLLSCDTISQAKAKIIDAMYRTVPDSLKPTPNDVDVEWKNGSSSSLRLVDMLHNTQDGWKQLDTLGTLNIDDQAVFQCIPRQSPPPFMSQSGGAPSCNSLLREIESGRVWHLERDLDCDSEGKGMSGVKSVPEVFLTRLSATKIPLQKFVDDLFDVIFTPNQGVTNLPPCVKYLMDFLDEEANRLQVNDPELLHTWKNNALPLRYWISIIKSPDVIFDVRKNNNIDSCLSVVAQTFIDATYYEDMTIDKTSQSSRLLYCKEIPTYKQHVREYYGEIQTCPPVSESDIDVAFNKNKSNTQLKQKSALYELYRYASRFSEELRDALQEKGYRDLADQFLSISDMNTTSTI